MFAAIGHVDPRSANVREYNAAVDAWQEASGDRVSFAGSDWAGSDAGNGEGAGGADGEVDAGVWMVQLAADAPDGDAGALCRLVETDESDAWVVSGDDVPDSPETDSGDGVAAYTERVARIGDVELTTTAAVYESSGASGTTIAEEGYDCPGKLTVTRISDDGGTEDDFGNVGVASIALYRVRMRSARELDTSCKGNPGSARCRCTNCRTRCENAFDGQFDRSRYQCRSVEAVDNICVAVVPPSLSDSGEFEIDSVNSGACDDSDTPARLVGLAPDDVTVDAEGRFSRHVDVSVRLSTDPWVVAGRIAGADRRFGLSAKSANATAIVLLVCGAPFLLIGVCALCRARRDPGEITRSTKEAQMAANPVVAGVPQQVVIAGQPQHVATAGVVTHSGYAKQY